ncbi:NADP-dependent oxidoreductase [Actinospica durhamensis]|uniref:NADP-dependent oxidoreductase n=1 Tax=Actinospica durhamensis TaxID=1508375 RepID=A0A941IT09_9ACTN|nr:NADP-dependent oxidoreductase [Actinospica durhamensis]MBR7837042.1 NADP-dependent oxidoreductase [Actinospica durhamensis]
MRAIVQSEYGGPEVLEQADLPVPEPGPGEIRIRVRAAAVNPTDWKHRAAPLFLGRLPLVLGWDVAGIVDKLGYGVTIFDQGDEVFGMLPYPHGVGGYAEYVLAPARAMVRKPENLDFVEAAALPLASLTAWQALNDTAHLTAGQRVLIQGAAGGVGHLAVQIAARMGAKVIGTASAEDLEYVRSLGAAEALDYRTTDLREAVREADAALVPLVGDARVNALSTVRAGGTFVTLLRTEPGGPEERVAAERGVRYRTMLVQDDHAGMQVIADLARSGGLRARIHDALPLSAAAEAHRLGEAGRIDGKLVLVVA